MSDRHKTSWRLTDPVGSEVWSWGDLFDVRLPPGWVVEPRGEVVELYPQDKVSVVAHVGVLEGGVPGGGLRGALARFASGRGAPTEPLLDTGGDADVAWAVADFDGNGGRWHVRLVAWAGHAVLCTACGHASEEAHLEVAMKAFRTLRPREVLRPAAAVLPPERDGDF